MRRRIGVAIGCAALVAAFAASAHAAGPDFGRCVKKAGGLYANAGCTLIESGKTTHEWITGPGPKPNFTLALTPGTRLLFESVSGTKLTCSTGTGSGTVSSSTEASAIGLTLTKCETGAGQCNTPGLPTGEVRLTGLEGVLGVRTVGATAAQDKLALDVHGPAGQPFARFDCLGVPVEIVGSVLLPTTTAKMLVTTTEKFIQTKGEQTPDRFAGGATDEHTLEWQFFGGPFEEVGLGASVVVSYEEAMEANPVA
jgi:hypothetical protein